VMNLDPVQLMTFLDATDAGLMHVNAILKAPARSDGEFRKKLDGLFRQLHSIKGEATAFNLMSAAQRVHVLEDLLSEIQRRPELSGNDFLPLLLKFDELMTHLRSVRELAIRLSALQAAVPSAATLAAPPQAGASMQDRGSRTGTSELVQTLNVLAEKLAMEHGKSYKLAVNGFGEVPHAYWRTVKDILIQLLRNAAVHGIESADARRASTKDEIGHIRMNFHRSSSGFELVCEDDGAGLNPEELKAAAVRKRLVTEEQAAAMDNRSVVALIFRPGFSTEEQVSMDAGRGVGMDVVARSVHAAGGKISVATITGKFTRFKISLPAVEESNTAVA
jgi:two-component system chemotaxis sensor kinase CheA